MMNKYLDDPSISFAGIGDCKCDEVALQCSEFGQGKEIDQLISKINLQRSGGGNEHESYELAAYFYAHCAQLENSELPFFFVTGDEGYWESIDSSVIRQSFGLTDVNTNVNTQSVWNALKEKYNVFHVHKPYMSANYETRIHKQWVDGIGEERVLDIVTPKACIDVILGAIALTSGRTLDEYVDDMRSRGQDNARIEEVTKALTKYSQKIKNGQANIVRKQVKGQNTNKTYTNTNTTSLSSNQGTSSHKPSATELQGVLNNFEKVKIEGDDNEAKKYLEQLKLIKQAHGDAIDNLFLCPITGEIMFDPVMTVDGHSFERKAIELWLSQRDTSPLTGEKLDTKMLLPNFALKQLIKEYTSKFLNK
jgi:hypothetical protein